MAYATIAQLQARVQNIDLRELTARQEADSGAMVGSVVQKALDDASAEMDSALSARYTVPVPQNPDCERVCSILARSNLYSWAGQELKERDAAEDKKAHEWLKLVALGTYNVIGATPINTGSKGGSAVVAPPPVFGDDFLGMY